MNALSVVIATLNRPADLKRALDSLVRQTRLPAEVLVVDQSEDDRSLDVVRTFASQACPVRHIRQTEKSLVKARNRGLAEAMGDWVSFLDDDVELLPDYYEKMERVFDGDPRVGAAGGSVISTIEPVGVKWALRKLIRRVFLITGRPGYMTASGFGYPIYDYVIRRPVDVQMLHGCNMNFRREAIGANRFDEWFAGYGFREDAEFTYRIAQHWKVRMIPDAKLHHFESPANRLDVDRLRRMEIRNYRYVFQKLKPQGPIQRLLFGWSLWGLLVEDAIEYGTNRNDLKRRKLKAAWQTLWEKDPEG